LRNAVAALLAMSLAAAQDAAEADCVLARAREKILAVGHRLPRYRCVETIHRDYFEPRARPAHKNRQTAEVEPCCEFAVEHPATDLVPAGWDLVRLDVAVADGREILSWPGASRFDNRRVDQIVTSGPTSTGAFGTYLVEALSKMRARPSSSRERPGPRLRRRSITVLASNAVAQPGSGNQPSPTRIERCRDLCLYGQFAAFGDSGGIPIEMGHAGGQALKR
jgi:hypothetical protein